MLVWTERYIYILLQRRWLVLLGTILLMVIAASGGNRLSVENNSRVLLGEKNRHLVALNTFENTYAASNSVILALSVQEGTVFTQETLDAIEQLTELAWQTPHSVRVDSLTNYNHMSVEGDDLIVEPLVVGAKSLDEDELSQIKEFALNEPDLAGRLVSRDGKVSALAISFVQSEDQEAMVAEVPDFLNDAIDEFRTKYPDLGFYMTGDVILNRTVIDSLDEGLQFILPLCFVLVVVASAFMLKSVLGVGVIVVMVLFGVFTTMGIAGWARAVLNPVTSGVPAVIMVLAVAQTIHIITSALLCMGQGLDRHAAIAQSLRINAWPVFLASATTIIGFLSLNSSDSPPIRDLGNLSALGMLCVYFYSMTLLPALLSVLPLRSRFGASKQSPIFERFGLAVVRRYKILLWSGLALCLVFILGIPLNEFSDDWTKQFDERYQFRRDTDFIGNNLTGLNMMEFSLESRVKSITDPEYLRSVEAFADWAREQPEVTHVRAFSDTMKRLNKNMNGADPEFYKIPDNTPLASQYLLLYELSIPFGGDLNDRIDIAKTSTRATVTLANLPASSMRELDQRSQSWFESNAPGFSEGATGLSMVFAYLTLTNLENMLQGTIVGMGLISFILIWVFKSIRLGLISLVPNFIPPAIVFGFWGYIVGQVTLTATITTIVAFGIIVDDTIHFMSKYLRGRREGMTGEEAVINTFRVTGHALFSTTIVLAAGFATFAFSGYEGLWVFGLMVSMMVVTGVVVDFLLLPALLLALDRRKA
ncbi:MAG: MMPL family transporter [Rhodobacteraceae bacterium]|nr:MMPL family transporter [Paracoccaceae bacterium]